MQENTQTCRLASRQARGGGGVDEPKTTQSTDKKSYSSYECARTTNEAQKRNGKKLHPGISEAKLTRIWYSH